MNFSLFQYLPVHQLPQNAKQLAWDAARTPPSDEDPPLVYIDRSLTILGRTLDTHNQRMRQEFLGQRDFISYQFPKVDRRFEEVENKMDKRMRAQLDQMQKISRNFLRTKEWEEIYPVGST